MCRVFKGGGCWRLVLVEQCGTNVGRRLCGRLDKCSSGGTRSYFQIYRKKVVAYKGGGRGGGAGLTRWSFEQLRQRRKRVGISRKKAEQAYYRRRSV